MNPRPQISDFNIYNDKKAAKRSTFLGKVKIPGNAFAKSDAAEFVYFPLEKRSVFSQIWVFSFLGVQNFQAFPPSSMSPKSPEPSHLPWV
ncbi:hypothetical protein ACFX2I_022226 [Malus domestica]|uniref:Uncharacterized protein n=1 Tax=Malus baccata TaxID=106549 RepID=A0A540K7D9_MALBA|nr:hypothetical protein C1H46_044323 [Malus baccata]